MLRLLGVSSRQVFSLDHVVASEETRARDACKDINAIVCDRYGKRGGARALHNW